MKVYYYVYKSVPLVPVQSQMNSLHALTYNWFNICFNIIALPTRRSSK